MGLFHMWYAWVAWVSFWNVPYLRSENNLRRFDFLRHRRFNWCKKVQFLSVTLTDSFVQVIIDNFFTISCSFFVSAMGLFEKEFSSTWVSQNGKLFKLKNESVMLTMSCEHTVAGIWTKSEEVLKSHGSSESSFSTKVTSRAEAKKLWKQKSLLWRSASFKRWKVKKFVKVSEEVFWKFLGWLWGSKTKMFRTCFVWEKILLKILENFYTIRRTCVL